MVANIAGMASEVADTRSWSTLPSTIGIARVVLAPGTYDIRVQLVDGAGNKTAERILKGIVIKKGGKKVAAAPLAVKKIVPQKVVNPLFQSRPKNFSIGQDVQPKRDLSRFVRWPK